MSDGERSRALNGPEGRSGSDRRARAEIARLARLLGRGPASLGYLETVPVADLRRLREQVTELLFDTGDGPLQRLAAASRLLPVGLVATLGERVFGPVLSARIAGLIEPRRAGQMAARMPTPFLADIAVELDPRRAEGILAALPAERVAEVSRELVRRGEFVAMASFVDYLPTESLRAAASGIDGRALLHIALVLESRERLDSLLGGLSRRQLEELIETATREQLWPETLELLDSIGIEHRRELVELAAGSGDRTLDALIAAAHRDRLWPIVLPLAALMGQPTLARFAGLERMRRHEVLRGIVAIAAQEKAIWPGLVPVLAQLPAPARELVLREVHALGPERWEEFAEHARALGLSEPLGLDGRRRAS